MLDITRSQERVTASHIVDWKKSCSLYVDRPSTMCGHSSRDNNQTIFQIHSTNKNNISDDTYKITYFRLPLGNWSWQHHHYHTSSRIQDPRFLSTSRNQLPRIEQTFLVRVPAGPESKKNTRILSTKSYEIPSQNTPSWHKRSSCGIER